MAKKKSKNDKDPNNHVVALNRRARHDYTIIDRYEAGLVLTGTEVKSLREGQASLVDGFAAFDLRPKLLFLAGAVVGDDDVCGV